METPPADQIDASNTAAETNDLLARPLPPRTVTDPHLYISRELSWLAFNRRVLGEAQNERHPLLERVKFLAIFGSNLDEFFMIRVSGLQQQRTQGITTPAGDGRTPEEALEAVFVEVNKQLGEAQAVWDDLQSQLCAHGITFAHHADLSDDEKAQAENYFDSLLFPILTPLSFDPGHPFPHISNLSVNLAVLMRDPDRPGAERFARVKIPNTLPRYLALRAVATEEMATNAGVRFVRIEEIVAHHIGKLFRDVPIIEVHPFRLTRDADIEIAEDEADDLLNTIEKGIKERHFGFVTRLEVSPAMSPRVLNLLLDELESDPRNLVMRNGHLGFDALWQVVKMDRPELKDAPHTPRTPAALATGENIFAVLARQEILLHHPYDDFSPVLDLVLAASEDPQVRAIKQTLYRVGSNSPLVPALIRARDADTQVAVLVELKARFDEANNITWARRLEEAGVHVVYGLIGLKTHCKALLIARQEDTHVTRTLHLGTGNYNAGTARLYTDFGLLTTDPALGADLSDLFNYLTGFSRQSVFRKLLVAPVNLRQNIAARIEREADNARNGRPARILFQMNALVDNEMIARLYAAAQAGVRVELIVRGVCSLRPGVAGVSENVRVVSLVGRFLEHCRAYYFLNDGGDDELYLGSADLMTRNLDRRVEAMFPISDPVLRHSVVEILEMLLRDNQQLHELRADGLYHRVTPKDGEPIVNAQEIFLSGAHLHDAETV